MGKCICECERVRMYVFGANNRICSTRHTNLTQLHSEIQHFAAVGFFYIFIAVAVAVASVRDWCVDRIRSPRTRFKINQFLRNFGRLKSANERSHGLLEKWNWWLCNVVSKWWIWQKKKREYRKYKWVMKCMCVMMVSQIKV